MLRNCQGRATKRSSDSSGTPTADSPESPTSALERDLVNVPGKGSKWRALPFSDAIGTALGRHLRVRAHHPYADTTTGLWPSDHRRGTPLSPSGIKIMLRRLPDRASDGSTLSPGGSAETSVSQP